MRQEYKREESSSCLIGHVEMVDIFNSKSEIHKKKICNFDDLFYCQECIKNDVCLDCNKNLTPEEIQAIRDWYDNR